MRYRLQTTDWIPKLPKDRHFLFLFDSFLYVVHLCLGYFFLEVTKILRTQVYLKIKLKIPCYRHVNKNYKTIFIPKKSSLSILTYSNKGRFICPFIISFLYSLKQNLENIQHCRHISANKVQKVYFGHHHGKKLLIKMIF